MFKSEAEPDKVVTVEASMIPVVLESRVFKTEASMEVSEMVIASFPNPSIPLEAYEILKNQNANVKLLTYRSGHRMSIDIINNISNIIENS